MCIVGYYCPADSAVPTPCPAGTASIIQGAIDVSTCIIDPPGTWSGTAAIEYNPCPPGTSNPDTGSSSSAACVPDLPGTYSNYQAAAATSCAAGTYAPEASSSSCTTADPGYFVLFTASIAETPCFAGTYSPAPGASACETDPAGSYSGAHASTPTLCPAGTFAPAPGSTGCTSADPGFYVPTAGASAELACPAGTYSAAAMASSCTPAPAGSYAPAGAIGPTACPLGTTTAAAGLATCTQLSPAPSAASVERPAVQPATSSAIPVKPTISLIAVKVHPHGQVQVTLATTGWGMVSAVARAGTVRYGAASSRAASGRLTLVITPTTSGRRAARSHRRLTVTITFSPSAGGAPLTRTSLVALGHPSGR